MPAAARAGGSSNLMAVSRRSRSGINRGTEDAGRAIAVALALALSGIFGVVLLLRLSAVIPFGMWLLLTVCMSVSVVAGLWALIARVFATPANYNPGPPVIKPRRVRALRSSNGHRPYRPDEKPRDRVQA